jgi:saccharopine dehydrogenase-like NADP-dependent oxidoreductase
LRGTLRAEGFCKAWNVLVQIGWTNDRDQKLGTNLLTYAQMTDALLPDREKPLKAQVAYNLGLPENDPAMELVEWTGIFGDEMIPLGSGTPAQILQELLERKWKLQPGDKDMIVMQHEFIYSLNRTDERITSSLVVKGEDEIHTAMAKTVGLPAAIAVKMILTGKYKSGGVVVPVQRELYEPVLKELAEMGIVFDEQHS